MRTLLFPALAGLTLLCFIASCGQAPRHDRASEEASTLPASALADTSGADSRVIIKTAELSMEVERLEPAVQDFRTLLQPLGGHIFHYEVEQSELSRSEKPCHTDSVRMIRQFNPTALLKVRVPAERADSFIAGVLAMNGTVNRFFSDEEDITEDLGEKKDLMLNLAGPAGKATTKKTADPFLKDEFSRRKAEFARSAYRTRFLWFDIRLQGRPLTRVETLAAVHDYHTPFMVQALASVQEGWFGLAAGLALLLRVWPLWILLSLLLWWGRRLGVRKSATATTR